MSHDEPTISHEVPAMPGEDAATPNAPTEDTVLRARHAAVRAPDTPIYETTDESEEWLEEPVESELPRRPRRRLLGTGGNPVPLALFAVLLIACGFIGGVLVEKGQSSSSGSASSSGLASRFAALRSASGTGAGGAGFGRGATSGGSGAGAFTGTAGASGAAGSAGGASATLGQVAYVSGNTLYVTNSEGNTVKVKTSVASTVSKTVKASVKDIHPGETVIVTGSTGANGAISAESIRVSEAGASGGLGALFGGGGGLRGFRGGSGGAGSGGAGSGGAGSGGAGSGSTGSGATSSGGGGEPALFGK